MNFDTFPICETGPLYDKSKVKKLPISPNNLLRSKLIQIHPTEEQLRTLSSWFDIYRWAYNLAIKHYRINPPTKNDLNFQNLRTSLTNQHSKSIYGYTKKTGIPKNTIDNAFKDVVTSYKSVFTNLENGNIKRFCLRYKRKKKPTETLCLEPGAFHKKHNSWSVRTMGYHIKSSSPINNIKHTSRLTLNKRTGKMILAVPLDGNEYQCKNRRSFISLDPGVRTFQTSYDKHNTTEIGNEEGKKIVTLLIRMNKLKRCFHKAKITLKRYHKAERKLWNRIQNIRDDLHWKTALKLVRNYDLILIGNMSTKSIIKKNKSVLTPLMKQKCLMLSNYQFKQRLKSKAEEYGATIKVINEWCTTATCGCCQRKHPNVGGSKVFECPHCGFEWGRDENAARNIVLVYFDLFEVYD